MIDVHVAPGLVRRRPDATARPRKLQRQAHEGDLSLPKLHNLRGYMGHSLNQKQGNDKLQQLLGAYMHLPCLFSRRSHSEFCDWGPRSIPVTSFCDLHKRLAPCLAEQPRFRDTQRTCQFHLTRTQRPLREGIPRGFQREQFWVQHFLPERTRTSRRHLRTFGKTPKR